MYTPRLVIRKLLLGAVLMTVAIIITVLIRENMDVKDPEQALPTITITVNGDIVLTAEWTPLTGFSVTYTSDGETVAVDTAFEDTPYQIIELQPESGDRIFVGWALEEQVLVHGDSIDVSGLSRDLGDPLHPITPQ